MRKKMKCLYNISNLHVFGAIHCPAKHGGEHMGKHTPWVIAYPSKHVHAYTDVFVTLALVVTYGVVVFQFGGTHTA
jgi:hypothetical protein